MKKKVIHTPEGVRDIYGQEYEKKWSLQTILHEHFSLFGFQSIQTPTFEFFDVFGNEVGTTRSNELFKFFDKEGNTLVLRSDFTPSMARCASKYFVQMGVPVRLSYLGNTFTNTSTLQGKLKEITQAGIEIIGDDSIYADAEAIQVAALGLRATGLKEFQISVGEMGYFKGICEEAGLDEETELALREFISLKNYFGAEELLNEKMIAPNYIQAILSVTDLFGGIEILEQAKKYIHNEKSLQALDRLKGVYDLLCEYELEQYISFDLGMLSMYNYYTGVVFKAYTYGVGDAILKGGRYDNLLSHFGKTSPAIGFVIAVDELLVAIASQKIEMNLVPKVTLIIYQQKNLKQAITQANFLRSQKERVEMVYLPSGVDEATFIKQYSNTAYKEMILVK